MDAHLDVRDDGFQVVLHPLEELLGIAFACALSQNFLLETVLLQLQVGDEKVQTGIGFMVPGSGGNRSEYCNNKHVSTCQSTCLSSSPSISLIWSFMSAISCSRGSICFFSSLIL